jgi:hypothetical protein
MGIVTLAAAKRHLRPPGTIDDVRIEEIIEQATVIVLRYIKAPLTSYQTSDGEPIEALVPPDVKAACLLVIGALYDNADGQDATKQPLSESVKALLHALRVPTLA